MRKKPKSRIEAFKEASCRLTSVRANIREAESAKAWKEIERKFERRSRRDRVRGLPAVGLPTEQPSTPAPSPWQAKKGAMTLTVSLSGDGRIAIYALVDPFDNTARYIGKTCNPGARLQEHIEEPHFNHGLRAWIEDLRSRSAVPQMQIIEWCKGRQWKRAERRWIFRYRALGVIYNIEDGGSPRKRRHRSARSV